MKKYRPSNGTEGEFFQEKFCYRCKADQEYQKTMVGPGCPILAKTLFLDIDDDGYPEEWCYDPDPVCKKFEVIE